MIPQLPAPQARNDGRDQEGPSHDARSAPDGRQRAQGEQPLPTVEDCLRTLHNLSQLIVLNLITTAQANAIRGNLREILAYHRHQQADTTGARLPFADLRRMVRENPSLVNLLESLLSPEQISELLRDPGSEDDV